VIVMTIVGLIVLWPGDKPPPRTGLGLEQQVARGTVARVVDEPCAKQTGNPAETGAAEPGAGEPGGGEPGRRRAGGRRAGRRGVRCGPDRRTAAGALRDRPDPDRRGPRTRPRHPRAGPAGRGRAAAGDRRPIVLTYEPRAPEGSRYQISDFQRGQPLALLALVFGIAVVAFARWRGLAALAGLAVSFAILLVFVLPAILAGSSPLLVAVVGAQGRSCSWSSTSPTASAYERRSRCSGRS
jgi:hypothetical protein